MHRSPGNPVVTAGQVLQTIQVLMCFRLALRALLLAGREPWLAFLRLRCGLDMVAVGLEEIGGPAARNLALYHGRRSHATGGRERSGQPLGRPPLGLQGLTERRSQHVDKTRQQKAEQPAQHG